MTIPYQSAFFDPTTCRPGALPRRQVLLQSFLSRVRPAFLASILKSLLGSRRLECETAQGRYWVDPYSHFGSELTREGAYEMSMCETLASHLGPGGVFVDAGANEGFFSVVAGRLVGRDGRVVAIEPQSRLQMVIGENLRLNGVENAWVVQAALCNESGTAELHLSPDTNTGSSGLSQPTRYRVPVEKVRAATLAELLAEAGIEKVDLMKMDIEGFEDDAIFGSKELFEQRKVRVLALELHRQMLADRGRDHRDVVRFLEGCGYTSECPADSSRHRLQLLFTARSEAPEAPRLEPEPAT